MHFFSQTPFLLMNVKFENWTLNRWRSSGFLCLGVALGCFSYSLRLAGTLKSVSSQTLHFPSRFKHGFINIPRAGLWTHGSPVFRKINSRNIIFSCVSHRMACYLWIPRELVSNRKRPRAWSITVTRIIIVLLFKMDFRVSITEVSNSFRNFNPFYLVHKNLWNSKASSKNFEEDLCLAVCESSLISTKQTIVNEKQKWRGQLVAGRLKMPSIIKSISSFVSQWIYCYQDIITWKVLTLWFCNHLFFFSKQAEIRVPISSLFFPWFIYSESG